MTTFTDGPAMGKVLTLRRAPLFLRITRDADGTFDGLDQLADTPTPAEALFVYRLVKAGGTVHINRGRCGGSGFYAIAEYALHEPQPADATMRSTRAWRDWCEMEFDRLKAVGATT